MLENIHPNPYDAIAQHCIEHEDARGKIAIRNRKTNDFARAVLFHAVTLKNLDNCKSYLLELLNDFNDNPSGLLLQAVLNQHDWLVEALAHKGHSLTYCSLGDLRKTPMYFLLRAGRFDLLEQLKQPISLSYAYNMLWDSPRASWFVVVKFCQDMFIGFIDTLKKWGAHDHLATGDGDRGSASEFECCAPGKDQSHTTTGSCSNGPNNKR